MEGLFCFNTFSHSDKSTLTVDPSTYSLMGFIYNVKSFPFKI